ncbi:MAG: hypothetical protein SGILL_004437 [Bacillariaceae sp.]
MVSMDTPTQHSNNNAKARSSTTTVPYFVLKLSDGKAKALFTIPSDMAEALIQHPILCRGASFDLEIDVVSQGRRRKHSDNNDTTFLSAHFCSPHPEETARAISERLRIRMGTSGTGAEAGFISDMLGMR